MPSVVRAWQHLGRRSGKLSDGVEAGEVFFDNSDDSLLLS